METPPTKTTPKLSGLLNNDVIAHASCPRCHAAATERCKQPSGDLKYDEPHRMRLQKFKDQIGLEAYNAHYTAIGRRQALGLPTAI